MTDVTPVVLQASSGKPIPILSIPDAQHCDVLVLRKDSEEDKYL